MDVQAEADRIAGLLQHDRQAAASAGKELEELALDSADDAIGLVAAYAARLDSADPLLAVFAGSLVERGVPAQPLAEALTRRFAKLPLESPTAPSEIEPLSMAAATAWARDATERRAAHENRALRDALARWLASAPELRHGPVGALAMLLGAPDGESVAVWFPELQEAWQARLEGCVTMGQLSVLAAEALAEPLHRIGALAAYPGTGSTFTCDFHVFPCTAVDPADGLPKTGRAVWKAPGGWGAHSLPPDALVGELPRVHGQLVAVVTGPRAASINLVRALPAEPDFCGMHGTMREAAKLDAEPAAALQRGLHDVARAYTPSEEEKAFLAQPGAVGFVPPRTARTPFSVVNLVYGVFLIIVLAATVRGCLSLQ